MDHLFETTRRTILLKLLPGVVDRVDAMALASGRTRTDWLRKAVIEKLNRDTENKDQPTS